MENDQAGPKDWMKRKVIISFLMHGNLIVTLCLMLTTSCLDGRDSMSHCTRVCGWPSAFQPAPGSYGQTIIDLRPLIAQSSIIK